MISRQNHDYDAPSHSIQSRPIAKIVTFKIKINPISHKKNMLTKNDYVQKLDKFYWLKLKLLFFLLLSRDFLWEATHRHQKCQIIENWFPQIFIIVTAHSLDARSTVYSNNNIFFLCTSSNNCDNEFNMIYISYNRHILNIAWNFTK